MNLRGDSELRLTYEHGTVVLETPMLAQRNMDREEQQIPASQWGFTWDERTRQWRAPGCSYREVVLAMREAGMSYRDDARAYGTLDLQLTKPIVPRVHQAEALRVWAESGRRGVIQLPTGAGKTILAVLAIVQTGRSALVIVPTIDLLNQWHSILTESLGIEIGTVGGGNKDFRDITVATYDSAAIFAERLGPGFGLMIVDECHHLPAPQYRKIALCSLAPFRLGLSATVERADGKEQEIFKLLGPLLYEGRIQEMRGDVLSPYDVISIEVPLSPEEEAEYRAARQIYTDFVRRAGVDFRRPDGWVDFLRKAARIAGGREALRAHRQQKRLAQAASAKLSELWRILDEHREDKVIIFTDDNAMAYRIGAEFVLPVITHQTKLKERQQLLASFRSGELNVLVTSKVLNEGVDVPDARIGIVISGSGAVREHVQRLGRILRHRPGKRAVLYELISKGTSEYFVNQRRKRHDAYQGTLNDAAE